MRAGKPTHLENPAKPIYAFTMPTVEISEPPAKEPACSLPDEHHSVFCPSCSARLEESRCKLVCRTGGYFMSCADFY